MIFDIVVIAVLLISALHAFWRGFIREVLTIFGAIGGVFAAVAYGDDLRPMMDGWLGITPDGEVDKLFDIIPMTIVSAVLSYGSVFIVVFGVLSFISHLIAEQVRSMGLGAVDRTLGVVFGLVRAALILGIFYLPVHLVMDQKDKDEYFKESKTHMYVEGVSIWLESVLPENMLFLEKKEENADKTRDDLEKLDVLKQDDAGTSQPQPAETPAPAGEQNGTGYGTPQREILNKLIEKGLEQTTGGNQE